LLGTYGLFILFLNLAGLVPGFNPPTDQFNITFAFAIVIFLLTHTLGMRQHGASYIKQFIGPMPLMAPLMFPVELISHLVRPMSLSIRLLGNMTGDHKVVLIFSSILALGLPVPFMGLGILISVLQAFVFVLLSAIYFEVAMSESH
jgi:F-type H+-transporting ATPase subunit a